MSNMTNDRKEIEEIKTEIAVLNVSLESLNNNLKSVGTLLQKMDDTTAKVYSLDSSIKLIEQKIDTLSSDASYRRTESQEAVRAIKKLMADTQNANEAILNDKMNRIFSEIKDLREETRTSFKEAFDELRRQKIEYKHDIGELERRVSKLENWKWWMMGIGVTVVTATSIGIKNLIEFFT